MVVAGPIPGSEGRVPLASTRTEEAIGAELDVAIDGAIVFPGSEGRIPFISTSTDSSMVAEDSLSDGETIGSDNRKGATSVEEGVARTRASLEKDGIGPFGRAFFFFMGNFSPDGVRPGGGAD